jgi:glycosyltransferase involved in cell wall biosynthesis
VPIKNIEGLLVAFSQIETHNRSLVIIGDGAAKNSLSQLAVSLGISSKVQFLGFQNDVSQFLVQAHCFVLPSFSEGSSVALAEAMMAELPSIVTKIGGASEILGDSKSGILIDPYDALDLKDAMNYMIGLGHEERREMGKHAREYVAEKYSPSTHVDQLIALYGEVLNGKD